MITIDQNRRSSPGARDRCRDEWSRSFVWGALLLLLCTVGCGAPSPTRVVPVGSPQTVVVAPSIITTVTSDVPSPVAGAATGTPRTPARSVMPATPGGSSPPSVTVLTQPQTDTATWQRYQHDAYGVSFQYPPCFAALESWQRPGQTTVPLLAVSAPVMDRDACPIARLLVELTSLDTYQFAAMGATYAYDVTTMTWLQRTTRGSRPYVPPVVQGPGWTGYSFSDGDAGFTYYAVAIPCQTQPIMLELGVVSDDPTSDLHKRRTLVDSILTTLQC